MNYLVLLALLCMQYVCKSDGSYYWKDYHNKIPEDAYKAGEDINKENIYIGQALLRTEPNQGIYPISISPGKDVFFIQVNGVRKADNFIQILCSNDPENFEWIQANSSHFHLMEFKNDIVRGGQEGDSWINIGRLKNYQGGTVIGKVISFFIGHADLWFVHNGNGILADSYEVLTYNDLASKIKVRVDKS